MGFFDKILKRTWQSYSDRGDVQFDSGEAGLALQEYRLALLRFDGTEQERQQLEEKKNRIHTSLRTKYFERGQRFVDAKRFKLAYQALSSAWDHSIDDAERAEVHAIRQKIIDEVQGPTVDPDEPFITVLRPTSPVEAELLTGLLRRNNIAAQLVGTRHGALAGLGQIVLNLRIEVPESQADDALAMLEAIEADPIEDELLAEGSGDVTGSGARTAADEDEDEEDEDEDEEDEDEDEEDEDEDEDEEDEDEDEDEEDEDEEDEDEDEEDEEEEDEEDEEDEDEEDEKSKKSKK